jgi:transposase
MENILSVYQRPYDSDKPLICMDETSKQHTIETRCPVPIKKGKVEKFDTEYQRNGVSNLFIWSEPLTGKRKVKVTNHRKRKDWAIFIKELVDIDYPKAQKIVLVMDNLNTHTGASLYEIFSPEEAQRILERLEIHYTPKHGSWLNMAEIELSHLSRQCLDRRIPDQQTLITETKAWVHHRNENPASVQWQFTIIDARIKLKHLYPIFNPQN